MHKNIFVLVVKMQEVITCYSEAYKDIKKWFDSTNKNALLIDGARQIGKTDLIREFLKNNVQSYIEFNLYENDLSRVL